MNHFSTTEFLPSLPSFVGYVLGRGTLLLIVSLALALLVRRQAALRHRLSALALGGLLLLPLLSGLPRVITVYVASPPPTSPLAASDVRDVSPPTSSTTPTRAVPPSSRHLAARSAASQSAPLQNGLTQPGANPSLLSLVRWRQFVLLFACGIWLLGAACVLGRALRSHAALRCLVKTASPAAEFLSAQCASLAVDLGIRRPVALRVAAGESATVPMTWGWRTPTVLLPGEALAWSAEQRRSALLHELSHIKRGDWAAQCLAMLVCALYWFHPLVWLCAARLRADAERATDEQVVASGVKASDYCAHLLTLARAATRGGTPLYATCAVPMARSAHLERRLRPLLQGSSARRGLHLPRFVATGILGFAFVIMATLQFTARAVPPAGSPVADVSITPPKGDSWDARIAETQRRVAEAELQVAKQQRQLAIGKAQTAAVERQVAEAQLRVAQSQLKATQEQLGDLKVRRDFSQLYNSYSVTASYTARCNSYTTVSLLGVSDPLARNGRWWTPKGQPLPPHAFKTSLGDMAGKVTPGHKLRQFVVRIHRAHPDEEDWGWSSDPFPTSSATAFYDKWKPPYAGNGQLVSFTSLLPQGQSQSNFKMFMTLKPWRTLVENRKDATASRTEWRYQVSFALGTEVTHHKSAMLLSDGDIVVRSGDDRIPSYADYKGVDASITVSHNIFDQDVRVVAVDDQGREHMAWLTYTTKGQVFQQLTSTFKGLPLSHVRAFRLQVQPVCNITFPNIPLTPPSAHKGRS